jgi:hypothetical protein
MFVFFFILSAGVLVAWRRAPQRRAGIAALALVLVVIDLWTFGGEIVQVVDVEQSTYWRIVSEVVSDPGAWRVLPWGLNDFEQNGGMAYGLRSVFGYDPLILQRYEAFITSRPDPLARTYDLLNARYLVTPGPEDYGDAEDAPKLLVEEAGVWVYERPTALPRAWIVQQIEVMDDEATLARIHDPSFDPLTTALVGETVDCGGTEEDASATFLRDEGNRITTDVEGGGGLLIFSEVDYPGWRATVDGAPVPLVRADYLLRAVCVPAGPHRVELVYDSPLWKIGLVISLATLTVIVGFAIALIRQRRGST